MGDCERLIAHAVLLGAWVPEGDPHLGMGDGFGDECFPDAVFNGGAR